MIPFKHAASLLLVAFLVLGSCTAPASPAKEAVTNWLQAMAGETPDRGWSMLSSKARDSYGDEPRVYQRDADATDWSRVHWTIDEAFNNDGTWIVMVLVNGGWGAVPTFMRERPLVQPYCKDQQAVGLIVGVTFDSTGATIHPGLRSGTFQREGRCP